MKWVKGHPRREPCFCLATGPEVEIDTGCGTSRRGPRFLLAVRTHYEQPHTWRLRDSLNKEWLSGDLGEDRDTARSEAERILTHSGATA